jgi:hypothetical protein
MAATAASVAAETPKHREDQAQHVDGLRIELIDEFNHLGANRIGVAPYTLRALRVGRGHHGTEQADLLWPASSVRCATPRAGCPHLAPAAWIRIVVDFSGGRDYRS